MALTDTLPNYRLRMNVAAGTTGWVLDVSTLGTGTIMRAAGTGTPVMTVLPGLLSATMTRGRSDELGQTQAGTATFVLDNHDGRYSPLNTGSPYYPYLLPRRQIALDAQFGVAQPWYTLWYGYVESIKPVDSGPVDNNITITASDWLAKAATTNLNGVRADETDQQRFQWICGQVGTDSFAPVTIGPVGSPETVKAITYVDTVALQALQDLAQTTRGVIYVDQWGVPTYRNRYGKFTQRGNFYNGGYTFNQFGVDNGPLVLPYTQIDYDLTLLNLYNEIRVTGSDGVEVVKSDTNSEALYGLLSLALNLATLDPTRAADLATLILSAYKTPAVKVHSITLDGDAWLANNNFASWSTLFQLDLGNTVIVRKSLPASAGINKTMFIEQITHTIAPDMAGHTITLQLSDVIQAGPQPWILGTSPLGSTTTIAY